jgi:chemotaxis protein methyltransferase CheR
MYESAGLAFNDTKKTLIHSRLAPRIQRLGIDSFEAYLATLLDESQPAEFQMAVDLLTTNETYFFREPRHFEILAEEVIRSKRKSGWRLWSAAASFGDEAYTLTMVLSDLQQMGRIQGDWQIIGTDISHRVLQAAKEGIYPQDRLRHVPMEQRKKYCLVGDGAAHGQMMIHDRLRQHVQFGQLNLTRDFDGLGMFDVVFLRNVLIYFDAATKIQVVDRVLSTLKPGGLFFMGTAEGRVASKTPMTALAPGAYRKAGAAEAV